MLFLGFAVAWRRMNLRFTLFISCIEGMLSVVVAGQMMVYDTVRAKDSVDV